MFPIIKKIIKGFKHPRIAIIYFIENSHLFDRMDDEKYLKLMWRMRFGTSLDLDHPQTYTEKMQWLKLYNRRPEYSDLVDKFEVKKIVADKIGDKYIIPTLGVWDSIEDIDWDSLPNQFVLKTTNGSDSSGVVICRDKNDFDIVSAKNKLAKSLKLDIYKTMREWPYKGIKKRIIAEAYLSDSGQKDGNTAEDEQLKDYKFYCFSGEPKFMMLASNRFSTHNFNFYDMSFNKLPITSVSGTRSEVEFEKPRKFEEMKEIASILSQGFAHIRVDLYYSGDNVYFGELTFFDTSGYDDFSSPEWNLQCGKWLVLPEKSA